MAAGNKRNALPGFRLTLGFTIAYLLVIALIPLSTLFFKTATVSGPELWREVFDPRAVASYQISFGTAFAAAALNAVFGFLIAWVLARYDFPLKGIVNGLIDLPFALPTAVAGITLTAIYSRNGSIGGFLHSIGIESAYSPLGIVIALTFIGLPFVVRTVEPVLEDFDRQVEEAAACLGATRWQTLRRVVLPLIFPAILTGFSLAFARALGEYGSVVFIAGNMPYKTEITPLLIMTKLDQYDYTGATAIALVMLLASFILLGLINLLQARMKP